MVIAWLGKRQAKHPMASFLLQTLAAIEACHGFFLHSAYLRTYHNVVANALTREDAKEVMEKAGLECLPDPTEDLERFLDRGWQRREPEADRCQALQLAKGRQRGECLQNLPVIHATHLRFLDFSDQPQHYTSSLLAHGAAHGEDEPNLVCISLAGEKWAGRQKLFLAAVTRFKPVLIWVDSRDEKQVSQLGGQLEQLGYHAQVHPLCGRTLKDQVWWKRWVLMVGSGQGKPYPHNTADAEPITPPLSGYPVEWLLEDSKVPKAMWEPGVLKIDPSMPFLGATKPKPAGTFTAPGKPRALVWDPCRPLPGLHDGS